jgi:hypothetical protein
LKQRIAEKYPGLEISCIDVEESPGVFDVLVKEAGKEVLVFSRQQGHGGVSLSQIDKILESIYTEIKR